MNEQQTYITRLYTNLKALQFKGLGRLYIVAISIIVIVMLATQALIQNFINDQQQDATVINIAGRQRMLSQKITKVTLQLYHPTAFRQESQLLTELREARDLWVVSHQELSGSAYFSDGTVNSHATNQLYQKLEPYYNKLLIATDQVINNRKADRQEKWLKTILEYEGDYLELMDDIVFQYNREAANKVDLLKETEFLLLLISLSVVAFELFFIFRPTARQVIETVQELESSRRQTKALLKETEGLYQSLGLAYQALSDKEEKEPPSHQLLIKADTLGNTFVVTDFFTELMQNPSGSYSVKNIKEWLVSEGYQQDFVDQLWSIIQDKGVWSGEVRVTSYDGDFIWLDLNMVKVNHNGRNYILVLGADLTDQKEAEEVSKEINQEKIEREIRDQQIRSALIMEGQEEERKRISKDIHDGVGQLLTGLKFKLESVNLKHEKHASNQLKEIRELVQGIISESRRISFNLAPSSLSDYGIVSVLGKFAKETNRLSEYEVQFVNVSGFLSRLDPKVEVNVYRIVQEAVNNALKYAEGEKILIELKHDPKFLTITVTDNGKGFDLRGMEEDKKGLGLLNMEERTNFINGNFEISSEIGEGTTVMLKVPLG
ncbi:ATP-binding protein [Limibacter armeniacum]|uniref:sensor histidine kinase n=1 Tax=Limibacter armeniacum TaxID=466084 RepID=UPI002FE68474